ncbi:MAG: hypothetical protein R8P61_26785 [Bacteroidia bacterium]|nr:hypothetical protein [Bacteroidia bacterium]
MAKKFLETLGDVFEDDMLQDVIPMRKGQKPAKRKNFLKALQDEKSEKKSAFTSSKTADTKKRRKSFLESIEDALENNAFDDIIPNNPSWTQKKKNTSTLNKEFETRLSTSIPTNVLDRAKEIAKLKQLNLKEVIHIALKWYVENDGKL